MTNNDDHIYSLDLVNFATNSQGVLISSTVNNPNMFSPTFVYPNQPQFNNNNNQQLNYNSQPNYNSLLY
jgi:hypothetical protein